jgi:chemotaxis response regulator CheB
VTQPIRVLVAKQPRLMRELVLVTVIEQPDIEIAAKIKNEKEIGHAVDGTHPDVLIIALDESGLRPSLRDALLLRYPKMNILALVPERNVSIFFLSHIQ